MLPGERQEQVARSNLRLVQETLQHGGTKAKKMALDSLLAFLERTRFYNPIVEENFTLLVKLACENEKVDYVKPALMSHKFRVSPLSVNHMRDSLTTCLQHGQSIVERAVKNVEEATQKDTVEESIFRCMTGMSHQERGRQCFLDPAFRMYMDIVKPCLMIIERVSKFEQLYQDIVRTALNLCHQHNRTLEMTFLNNMLRNHVRDVFFNKDREAQRETIIASAETLSSIVQTKQDQTRIARETRDWRGAVDVMRDVRQLTAKLHQLKRTLKVADLCPVWELEAEVHFAAGNFPFHAFQCVSVARRRIFELGVDEAAARTIASQAVLAVLCVPDKQLSTSDEGSDRLIQLSKTLSMVSPPNREGLLNDIERQTQTAAGGVASILSFASPFVRDLYNLLVAIPSIEICKNAAPLLKKVSEQSTQLARYVSNLENVAVRAMLGIMSRCFSAVGINDFIGRCGGIFKADGSDFAPRVEPLLLRESFGNKVQIVVDFGSRHIFFLPSAVAADNLISFQSSLAAHVAEVTRKCYDIQQSTVVTQASTTAAASKKTSGKEKSSAAASASSAKNILAKLEDSRTRVLSRFVVCKQRIDNFKSRLETLHQAELKRRQEELVLRESKEDEKIAARKKKAEEALNKTIAEEEEVERRKWVVQQANNRHKGVGLPVKLAEKNNGEFLTEASQHLLRHMREAEMTRSSDVKTMTYWERACREVEAPLRKEYFRVQGEEQAATRELQTENRHKQHRRAFDEAFAMKQKLSRLMKQKTEYETDVRETFAIQQKKLTSGKHGAQDDDMDRMMKEREVAAAAAKRQ